MRLRATRWMTGSLVLAALGWVAGCAAPGPSAAAEPAACVLCGKEVPAGQGVVASVRPGGGEPRVYRCIHCALTDLEDEEHPFTLEARSPVSHQAILLSRNGREWTVTPPS